MEVGELRASTHTDTHCVECPPYQSCQLSSKSMLPPLLPPPHLTASNQMHTPLAVNHLVGRLHSVQSMRHRITASSGHTWIATHQRKQLGGSAQSRCESPCW